ncbi:MAG: methyltransferase domain-containing protein [Planctomycetota bacterium]
MPADARQATAQPIPARDPARPLRRLESPDPRSVKNRRFFDGYWSAGKHERDRLWRDWWHDGYEQMLTWAGPLAGKRVVNLFAGLCEDAEMLAQTGASVVAVDFSLAGLANAAHAPGRRVEVDGPRMLCADASKLPLPDGSVDVVIAINGLCHTPKAKVLAECRRVLAPDGRILLLEVMRYPHLAMLARFLEPYKWHAPHKFISVGELEELARDFSFARHREFFCLSVLSAMLVRLPLGAKLFLPLHRLLTKLDRPLLRAVPFLRRFSYLCAAELRP